MNERTSIKGKLVLITGASSGIGEATAKAIAHKGGKVVLLSRTGALLERIVSEITYYGGQAISFPVDLSNVDAVSNTAKKIIYEIGIPDVLVNNAGAGRWLTVEETSGQEAERMIAVPFLAAFNLTREFLSHMRKRGSGHIVNISSVASRLAWPGAAGYIASRYAVNGFTDALRTELYGTGISVTQAIFGTIKSPYWIHNPGSRGRVPKIGRFIPDLTPEQVAHWITESIEKRPRKIVRPRIYELIFFLNVLFPRISERIMLIGWQGNHGVF